MKIVVCDDEAVFRNTLIEHISTYKDAKYEVVAYSSGEEVLRHIDEKDIYETAFGICQGCLFAHYRGK